MDLPLKNLQSHKHKKLLEVSLPKGENKRVTIRPHISSAITDTVKKSHETTSTFVTTTRRHQHDGQQQRIDGRKNKPCTSKGLVNTTDAASKLGSKRKTGTMAKTRPTQLATILSPKNYKVRPIVPAKKKELISVAKAMHREEFAPRVQKLFNSETNAALDAIESGVYIGWRCPEYNWDCIRLSKHSRCFCDHNLSEHASYNKNSVRVKCLAAHCNCKAFAFIPERPEDIGEWWLPKRPGFNRHLWRAKCRCKHTHDQHDANSRQCTVRSCGCFVFESDFLCAACDKHWENHETFFDGINSRKAQNLPHGQNYLPFHELPDLRNVCLTGKEDNYVYDSGASGPYTVPEFRHGGKQLEDFHKRYK